MRFKSIIVLLLLSSISFSATQLIGVQTHFGQFRRADMDSLAVEAQLDLCSEAGIDIIRDECLWSDVEIDSGNYLIPPQVDMYVRSALARGIKVYLILNYNNTLYASSNGAGVTSEANRVAYARYCQAVVSHFYPLGVEHYEIWNEPNHGELFWTPEPNAIDYTELLKTAYDSIKAIQAEAKVIGCATSPAIGNTAPYIEGLDFIRDVFLAGGADYMDAASFHLYQIAYRPENELYNYLNSLKSYVGDMPLYLSESGYPTHNSWPNISLDKQAQYVLRMFLSTQLDEQLKGVMYYDLKNDGNNPEEPEHNFGLLNFDRSPKPAYHALATMNAMCFGPLSDASVQEGDVFRLFYPESGVNVLWAYQGTPYIYHVQNNELPTTTRKYFRIHDMYGDTLAYYITDSDSIYIQLSENPIYSLLQSEEPTVTQFHLKEKEFLLYPGEKVNVNYLAKNEAGLPVYIAPSALTWSFLGSGGTLDNGRFTSTNVGSGLIIAGIQGVLDTLKVKVIPDPGHYTLEDFCDTAGMKLESYQLNMDSSRLSMNGSSINLHYVYDRSYAFAFIKKNILINSHADSIYLDMKMDEKECEFKLYLKDANNKSKTITLNPKPTTWTNSWGSLSGAIDLGSGIQAPLYIESISIKFLPGTTTQTQPYSGDIILDNLRIKKGHAVNIKETELLPETIELSQNYPNPFNGMTKLNFNIPYDTNVRLDILDLQGHIVSTEINKHLSKGSYVHKIIMKDRPSGIYFYRLSTEQNFCSRKFAYIK